MKKVAALVSGGVDSSVALALLKEQGYEITAFYLKIWLEDELSYLGECPWEQDLVYARSVCEQLDVPLQVVSMQKPYWDKVVSYTLSEIKAGRTPNPDVLCNQQVKFGAFYDAVGKEFDYIATGHYAQVKHFDGYSQMWMAPDEIKDQTYFLCWLSQQQLQRVLFPIGHLQKYEVRAKAHELNLANKDRKDSQGICFLGKFKFSDFLKAHMKDEIGNLVEFETGQVVGNHEGFWFYTIGQRHGIGLSGGPWYVVDKDTKQNIVYISKQYQDVDAHKQGMQIVEMNWINPLPQNCTSVLVKFRHGPAMQPATITLTGADSCTLMLETLATQGIAAGQFAVVYLDGQCFGGGRIEKAL